MPDPVEEVGQRLGVEGGVTTGADDWDGSWVTLGGANRHVGQVEAVEQVGVHQLAREVERDHVEFERPGGGCRPRTAAGRVARISASRSIQGA